MYSNPDNSAKSPMSPLAEYKFTEHVDYHMSMTDRPINSNRVNLLKTAIQPKESILSPVPVNMNVKPPP